MKIGQSISIFLCACIALLFLSNIYMLSDNTPFQDDVNYIDFIYHFAQKNQSLSDYLTRLFMVDNNHMALIPKLGISIQYLLFQDINFKRILLISAFQLCLICTWFVLQFHQTKKPTWMVLPLFLLWFQPQYYEIANWAMTGIQQSSVILCSLLALEFIAKPGKKNLLLAIMFAGMAFYSFGSGVLAYVGIGYYLLANKRYREIPWLFPLPCIQLATYLYMAKLGTVATASQIHISHAIPFFLNLVGTIAMVTSTYAAQAAWVIGGLMTLLAIFGLFKINYQSKIAALLIILLANCLLIVSSRDGLGIYMVSRFATISPLIGMSIYLLYLPVISLRMSRIVIFLSTLFCLFSYFQYLPFLHQQKYQAVAESANWTKNQRWLNISDQFQLYASPSLIPSYQQGLWRSENNILPNENLAQLTTAPRVSLQMNEANSIIHLSQFPLEVGLNKAYYLIFCKDSAPQKTYFKNIEFLPNSRKNLIFSGQWFLPQGRISFEKAPLEPGKYQIYLFEGNSNRYWKTDKTFAPKETI